LRVTFAGISEASMLSVLAHYEGQYGTYESFDLPNDIWIGANTVADYSLTGYVWRYAEPPSIEDIFSGLHNVTVSLQAAPADRVIQKGGKIDIAIALSAGQAAAASGISQSITLSLAPAVFTVPGLSATAVFSLAAAGAAASNGSAFSVSATFAAGIAAASSGADLSISLGISAAPTTGNVITSDYWSDMSIQMFGWDSLAYIDWWGN
jgi:hypothetical protein